MPDVFRSPRSSAPRSLTALVLLFAVVFAFGTGVAVGQAQKGSSSVERAAVASAAASDVDFQEFWQVWKLLKDRFYQPLEDQSLYEGAIRGMVAGAKDPYTVYFNKAESQEFANDLEGAFDGIGAEIGIKDDQLQIIAPLPGTPAEKADLRTGDAILAIDGTPTDGMEVGEAVRHIRGERGTKVKLVMRRGKEAPAEKELTRQKITVDSVKTDIKDGIATIDISVFGPDTANLFAKAANDVLAANAKGIILDLRGNPGGLLNAAVSIASAWVGNQVVVREKGPGIDDAFSGTSAALLEGIPTVVLVDGGSASASEILSGALQDYGLAKLVGTKTFGKGSVQDLVPLPDGSSVKVTIAAWHTPKDRSIQKTGIDPDVTVEFTEADLHARRDTQKEKALEILRAELSRR